MEILTAFLCNDADWLRRSTDPLRRTTRYSDCIAGIFPQTAQYKAGLITTRINFEVFMRFRVAIVNDAISNQNTVYAV